MASTDALPIPRKNVAFRMPFTIRNASTNALITSWTGTSGGATISKDGGNYATTTNDPTEIQTSGTGYIDLTSTEMNADSVIIKIALTNTGAEIAVFVLYPMEDTDIRTNLINWAGSAVNALQSGRVDVYLGAVASGVIAAASFASNALDAVWSTAIRTLTTYSDSSGVTTLLSRLTSTRAGLLDNLDATISGIPAAVWSAGTRTLTSFGTLIADIWANGSRTLSDKTGFSLVSDYDAAKTASSQISVDAIPTNPLLDNDVRLPSGSTEISTLTDSDIETDITTVLNTAVPSSPTTNSIFDYIKNKLSQFNATTTNVTVGDIVAV